VVAKKSRQKQAQKKRDEVVLKMQQSSADLGVDMAVGMEVEVDTDADTLFSLSGSEDDVLSAQQSSADLEVDMAVGMEVDADTLFSLSGSEDDVLSAQQSSADLGAEKVADILLAMLHDGFGGSKAHTTGPHPPSRKRSVYVGSKKSKSAKRKKVADLFTNESDGTR